MAFSNKRRRGTAIVETKNGIILAETKAGLLLLPGGGAEKGESRFDAAIRELREETGLVAQSALTLFEYESSINFHKVVWITSTGTANPLDDAVALHCCQQSQMPEFTNLSNATFSILNQFWAYKEKQEGLFKALELAGYKSNVSCI